MAQHSSETVLDSAKDLLAQGKRSMALEDYQAATDCLEQSCQLFDSYYGVAKRECADAYLEYGLALVALANLEAGSGTDKIMKKAGIEGEEQEDEEEEEDEDEDEADDEEAGDEEAPDEEEGEHEQEGEESADKPNGDKNQQPTSEEANNKQENGDPSANNVEQVPVDPPSDDQVKPNGSSGNNTTEVSNNSNNNTQRQQPQASSNSTVNDEPKPGTSSGDVNGDKDGDEAVDNEEATTIEIAWEVLCLAKRLFMTDESLEGRLKLAETLQKLGEISIEWDNNDNAVSILDECLNIRKIILPPEDRLIALTYYHLGLAHSFKSDTQNANDSFQKAIDVIEKRIVSLSADLETAKAAQDTIAISSYQKEINELKELLPDMTMRLDDSKEDGNKGTEALKRTRDELLLEDEEAKKVCLDKSKPVDDISHLVKRKAA